MNAERLLEVYEQVSEAPDAIARLRRFVLDLAVRGKLVEQSPMDEPASTLLDRMIAERSELERTKAIKKVKLSTFDASTNIIPENWVWTQLGKVGDWGSGSTPSRGNSDFYGGGVTWLKSGELGDTLELKGSEETVTEKALAKCSFRLNKPGDVLIAMYGATIGKLAILAERAVTNQAVCGCTPLSGLTNRYLFLFLLANRKAFHASSEGGAQPNISKAKIVNTAFPLPPLSEQHRIVAKVDELMALCDRLEEARKTREEVRDKLTAASLARMTAPDTPPEDFPAHAAFAIEVFPALTKRPDQITILRQTILNLAVRGQLVTCDGGSFQRVGEFRKLQNGYAFKSGWFAKSGVRLLRNANIGHGQIRWNDTVFLPKEMASEYERFVLNEGDVVLTLDRPFIATGTKVARVGPADLPSLLLQRVGRFVEIKGGLADDYLFMWINSPHFNDQIDPGRSNGVPHISSRQVEAAEIFVPSLPDQKHIVAKTDALMALCDQLEAALNIADTTRTRLLETLLHEALEPAAEVLKAAE